MVEIGGNMNDAEIIDWIEGHVTDIVDDGNNNGRILISYLDDEGGGSLKARGKGLREAVIYADMTLRELETENNER